MSSANGSTASTAPGSSGLYGMGEHAPSSLSEYGSALLRRWWLVIIGLAIGLIAAGGYLGIATKTYTSVASVQVTATGIADTSLPSTSRNASDVDMDTEAQVLKSDAVSKLAAAALKTGMDPTKLVKDVTVTVPPNSAVLTVSFAAHNAHDAQAGAQAYANSYLTNRASVAQGILDSELNNLREQLPSLTQQLEDVTGKTAVLPDSSADHAYAVAQAAILHSQIDAINAAIGPLVQQGVTPGRVLSPANLPKSASSPQFTLVASSGLIGGLLLGALLAITAVRRDRRIHRASEFATGLGLPLLAVLPSQGVKSIGLLATESAGASAIRELRDRLVGGGVEGSVLIVPLSGGAGGSLVAVNLAASLSADGSSCVLVCASPNSSAPLRLGMAQRPGLSDALETAITDVRPILQPVEGRPLSVLLPGTKPASLPDQLHGSGLRHIVERLRASYDHVVVEAPVWLLNRSALVLGRASEVSVLVAEAHLTTREQLIEAGEMLTDSGASVVGAVLVPRLRGTGVSVDGTRAVHRSQPPARPLSERQRESELEAAAQSEVAFAPEPEPDELFDQEAAAVPTAEIDVAAQTEQPPKVNLKTKLKSRRKSPADPASPVAADAADADADSNAGSESDAAPTQESTAGDEPQSVAVAAPGTHPDRR
jgi:Mrp family chromosome partitioning ATPase/capsular polysaccharide biosynthesis protein